MSRAKRQHAGTASSRLRKTKRPTADKRENSIENFVKHESALERQSAWLGRPRLHTRLFADVYNDEELERHFAKNNIVVVEEGVREIFEKQKHERRQELAKVVKPLNWSEERLKSFMQCVLAFRKEASIQSYLRVRREFPEVEIQVGGLSGMDALFELAKDFESRGIDPQLIAAALDANEPSVDALCLCLLELLAARDAIPKSKPGYIQKRRDAINDATVNYLITNILESYDWHDEEYRIPASLVVLIKHQICGSIPDLESEARSRRKRSTSAWYIAEKLKPHETISINKVARMAGVSRATAARWLKEDFLKQVANCRKLQCM